MPLLTDLWSRLREFVTGLFRKKPPEPGKFVADTKLSWRGFLAGAPLIAPQREYLAYVPASATSPWGWRRHPLLVLLHGCKQTPEEIAAATRVARLADDDDLLVLLPRQNPRANVWGCWNWFDAATARGWGETAIVAAQIRAVRRNYRIDRERVFVAGLSSGGALAAALGDPAPGPDRRRVRPFGHRLRRGVVAVRGARRAKARRRHRRRGDRARARAAADPAALPVPLVVVQGGADDVVAPINAVQLVRQYLALNGHPAARAGAAAALPPPDRTARDDSGERTVTTSEWSVGDRRVVRHVYVDRLGHAWSGGDAAYAWSDAAEPQSSRLLADFVRGDWH